MHPITRQTHPTHDPILLNNITKPRLSTIINWDQPFPVTAGLDLSNSVVVFQYKTFTTVFNSYNHNFIQNMRKVVTKLL